MEVKKTYTAREFAKLIGVTTRTLSRWDKQNILKSNQTLTNRIYYTQEQLEEVLAAQGKI